MTRFIHLYWGARYSAVAAKYTTIALNRLYSCFTVGALIEILTGISGHYFFFRMAASRAGYNRF